MSRAASRTQGRPRSRGHVAASRADQVQVGHSEETKEPSHTEIAKAAEYRSSQNDYRQSSY